MIINIIKTVGNYSKNSDTYDNIKNMTKETYDNMDAYLYRLDISSNNSRQNSLLKDRCNRLKMLMSNGTNNKNITDISMFADTLEVLYMSNTILDVGNLACMKKLRVLHCDREFDDLCIGDLTNLHNTIEVLRISGSQVNQSDLSKFKKIKGLYLNSNSCITDIKCISETIQELGIPLNKNFYIPKTIRKYKKYSTKN